VSLSWSPKDDLRAGSKLLEKINLMQILVCNNSTLHIIMFNEMLLCLFFCPHSPDVP
jgi:hypothetical protein